MSERLPSDPPGAPPSPAPVVSAAAEAPPALAGRALWLSFAAATTGTFMVNVDSSVVNVALPVMQHEFGLPIADLQWIVTGYLLIITGLLPVAGYLADALGRRGVFAAGIGVFVLGSLACATAPDFGWLVADRVFQGVGGAIIMANVMAIVASVFPLNQRGRALGLIGSVVAAGTLAGPPLGGLLTAAFGWRAIFWINLPVGVWGMWGSWRYLPRFRPLRAPAAASVAPWWRGFDWQGAAWFLAATTLLQLGLGRLQNGSGVILLVADAAAIALLLRVEARHPRPLIPLRVFRVRAFSNNLVSGMAYWVLMMFPAFLMPFYLRVERHLSEDWIGLSLVPQALAMIVVSPWGGRWADRRGVLPPGRLAMALFMVADAGLALLPPAAPLWVVWAALALIGVAAGLFSSPNNTAMLNALPPRDTGLASSLLATQRNLGRAVGVALASLALSVVWMAHGLGPNPPHTAPAYPRWFLWGFRGAFWSLEGFAAVGGWLLTDPRGRSGREQGG